jgi:uncharacterized protein YodC (DUF2158 family)
VTNPAQLEDTVGVKLVLLKDFLPAFNIGDMVRLKSGSPLLTVTACIDGQVEVNWFEETIAKQKIYPIAALRKTRNGSST